MQGTGKCQSLFVRELEAILRVHGSKIGNDLITKVEMHPQKVNRLKQLLRGKKGFHFLNPEELNRVIDTFHFSVEEQLRIRAAILATSVTEAMLDRIGEPNAIEAGEELFPILLKALRERLQRHTGLGGTRKRVVVEMREQQYGDDLLTPVLLNLDQAMLALHISQWALTASERMRQAKKARVLFKAVIGGLEAFEPTDKEQIGLDVWRMWYEEAQNQLHAMPAETHE